MTDTRHRGGNGGRQGTVSGPPCGTGGAVVRDGRTRPDLRPRQHSAHVTSGAAIMRASAAQPSRYRALGSTPPQTRRAAAYRMRSINPAIRSGPVPSPGAPPTAGREYLHGVHDERPSLDEGVQHLRISSSSSREAGWAERAPIMRLRAEPPKALFSRSPAICFCVCSCGAAAS